MNLLDRNIFLLVMDAFGDRITGRTMLQKRFYFLAAVLRQEMGYRAHYYGPYSDEVTSNVTLLKAANLLKEEQQGSGGVSDTGHNVVRYDYELTEDGRQAAAWLKSKYSNEADRIKEAVASFVSAGGKQLDINQLSVAAKVHWILEHVSAQLNPAAIVQEACELSWKITEQQVADAMQFLKRMNLMASA